MNALCNTCPHWKTYGGRDSDVGQCRIQPPANEGIHGGRRWPETRSDDFCGEHPKRKVAPESTQNVVVDVPMSLEGVTAALGRCTGGARVYFDFCGNIPTTVESWRGVYAEPAIGWTTCGRTDDNEAPLAHDLYASLKEVLDREFTGWKGGEYRYNGSEPLHVDNPGESCGVDIVRVEDLGERVVLHTRAQA